jgi:hypothetical protein
MTDEEIRWHEDTAAAERIVFADNPPTCPNVADILGVPAERYNITEADVELTRKLIARLATSRLRNALVDATRRAFQAEREVARYRDAEKNMASADGGESYAER